MTSVCTLLDLDYRMLVSSVNPPDNFRTDDLILVDLPVLSAMMPKIMPIKNLCTLGTKTDMDTVSKSVPVTMSSSVTEGERQGLNEGHRHLLGVLDSLFGQGIYSGFPLDSVPHDTQGFQSPENIPFFDTVFSTLRPRCLLELGSWKGTSAIMFAQRMRQYRPEPTIACVDTWTGSLEHWSNPQWTADLHLRWGYPTLYERFVANVIRAGVAPFITPMPMTTGTAIRLLRSRNVKVDAIYIDASHEYEDVLADLEAALGILAPSGFIIVDDFYAPGVMRAVSQSARRPGVLAVYNADAPWPEAFITENQCVLNAISDAYLSARPVSEKQVI